MSRLRQAVCATRRGLRRLIRLHPADVVRVFVLAPLALLILHGPGSRSLNLTGSRLARLRSVPALAALRAARMPHEVADLAAAIVRGRDRCYPRAMLLFLLLDGSLCLRIGVRPNGQGIESHAWIERDGRALDERHEPQAPYLEIYSLPAP